ncbi:MAG TPA: FKBP-type peptidyl-prolyl cis-trans isomerase [Flavipsychrobacter sp.]|nr:FKBP-type peptidyl-prolyl cis-trans isomerase [Flavipsychrobacter sp.]
MGIADRLFNMKNEQAAANLKAGEEFLAENAKKEGVVSLPSGLQYEVITDGGEGQKPTATQTVTCHYHGTLINGTIFDSSVQRGRPASFPLNRVISGWTEGLQLMSVGSKWRFFIPPHLGYGAQQAGASIGPNSTLIFEVELISIS